MTDPILDANDELLDANLLDEHTAYDVVVNHGDDALALAADWYLKAKGHASARSDQFHGAMWRALRESTAANPRFPTLRIAFQDAWPLPIEPPVVTPVGTITHTPGEPFFRNDGQPWRYKGVSAFGLCDIFRRGDLAAVDAFLSAYQGFNVLRVFDYVPVKDWGAMAWDSAPLDVWEQFVAYVAQRGFFTEITLLTDDDPARIDHAKRLVGYLAVSHLAQTALLEIGNEPRIHKAIDTAALHDVCAGSGFLYSSGEYEDSRLWFGTYLTAHTGRDLEWPRRAHDLLDYLHGGGPNFPEEPAIGCPAIADEPIRPDQAGFSLADCRAYYGACALLGGGATVHTESGKYGHAPDANEKPWIAAALDAMNAFPPDAPLGAYRRVDDQTLRTYLVGHYGVRIRPQTPTAPFSGTSLDANGILWTL